MNVEPHPIYKPSGNSSRGEVPLGWSPRRLTSCIRQLESGAREQTDATHENGVPNLGGEHIGRDGELLLGNLRYVSNEFFERQTRGTIRADDILLVKDGATIGKVAHMDKMPFERGSINEHVYIVRPRGGCYPRFLFHYLRSPETQRGIWQSVTGSAQPGLSASFTKSLIVNLPPLPEQRAIAKYLDYMDRRIQRYIRAKERLIELLEEEKRAVINHAVTRGLDPDVRLKPSGVEWLGDVPAHWEVRRLHTIASVTPSNVDKHVNDDELPVRLCNYVDVYKNDEITSELPFMGATAKPDEIRRFHLEKNDVLITKDSETWDDIGVPALVTETMQDVLCGYHLAVLRQTEGVTGEFLAWCLRSKAVSYQFHVVAKGVTRFGISRAGLQSVNVPVPSRAEQSAICLHLRNVCEAIDHSDRAARKEIELMKEYRTRLIADAVTGKLDVREAAASLPDDDADEVSGADFLGDAD